MDVPLIHPSARLCVVGQDRPGKNRHECGSYMVIRGSNLVCSDQSCGYSEKIGKEEGNQEVS